MRQLAALLMAATILFSGTTALAGEGAAAGTVLGATIGALTFNNKNTGAAVGAGVGLLTGMIFDAEKKRIAREKARDVQTIRPRRETVTRAPAKTPVRMTLEEYRASKRAEQLRSSAQFSSGRAAQSSGTGHLIRERRVTTRLPDGTTKVVTTKIYDDPGW